MSHWYRCGISEPGTSDDGEAAEIYSRAVAATPSNIDAIDGLIRSLQKTGGSQKIAAAYQKYRESIKPIKKK